MHKTSFPLRKIHSQKNAILENNSAGQVSCGHSAHFSGTSGVKVYRTSQRTEVEGAPLSQRVPPFVISETQAVFGSESVGESIEEESSGFYDLNLVVSKI